MGVRFVVGRAGTGKTRGCVEALARALAADPLGPPLWWIVPDQATFTAERALVARVGGSVRAKVLSFGRLAQQLALELGMPVTEHLDDLSRLVLLSDSVQACRERLALFGPVADRPGFLARLDAMLRELVQAGQTPAGLREVVGAMAGKAPGSAGGSSIAPAPFVFDPPAEPGAFAFGRAGDVLLARKLADLACVMETFEGRLAEHAITSERLVEQVTARLGEIGPLRDAQIWVDAFSALNMVEMRLLVGLAQQAKQVTVTLLADPASRVLRDGRLPLEDVALFWRTERLYRMLRGQLERAGVTVEPIAGLTEPRRYEAEVLRRIERGMFEPTALKDPGVNKAPGSAGGPTTSSVGSLNGPPAEPGAFALEIWETPDPQLEVRAVAQRICQLVATGQARYREIGLILPAVEPYVDRVRRIFAEHRIPHFVDQRRSIAHHPVVELVRSAVAWIAGGCACDDLMLMLKTGLTSIPDEDVHTLENYLLAHGIVRHALAEPFTFVAPNIAEDDPPEPATAAEMEAFQAVNRTRAALSAALTPWLEMARKPATAATLAQGVYGLLERLGTPAKIDALLAAARARQDAELAMVHEQAWSKVVELLETFARLGGVPRAIEAFAEMLQSALGTLTLGLIPPTIDQVLISSVARSRHPELKVVFLVGAVEQQLPAVRPEDPMLSDPQRAVFNQRTGDTINRGSDEQLLEAQFFDYVALTRASRQLVVTHPLTDGAGRAVAPSPYVARLKSLVPEARCRSIAVSELARLGELAALDDAAAAVLAWARQRRADPTAAAPDGVESLYNYLVTDGLDTARRTLWWQALDDERTPALAPETASALYKGVLRMSVSQLERFATCPMQFYLQYSLGLMPRAMLELDVLNLGTLQHGILEHAIDTIVEQKLPWPKLGADELQRIVAEAVETASRRLHAELERTTPHYRKVKERLTRTLGLVLEAQRRAAAAGRLQPVGTEVVFGLIHAAPDEAPTKLRLPALEVVTPAGRRVALRGKIDRLDICPDTGDAVVIDYKSAHEKKLDLPRVRQGLTLQLPVYLLAVAAHGERVRPRGLRPVAGFYVGLHPTRRTNRRPGELPAPDSDAFYQQISVRGVLDADAIGVLDTTADDGSAWYRFKRKKDGALAKVKNEALEPEDFALLLTFVRRRVGTLVDALCAGAIAPAPVREGGRVPCDACDFRAVCPFDAARGTCRDLPKEKPDVSLQQMRAEVGDE